MGITLEPDSQHEIPVRVPEEKLATAKAGLVRALMSRFSVFSFNSFMTESRWRALHVAGLCSFAFPQPLLTSLLDRSVYRHDLQLGFWNYFLMLFTLMMVLPAAVIVIDVIVQKIANKLLWGWGRNSVFYLLGGLISLSLLRPLGSVQFLIDSQMTWLLVIPLSFVAAVATGVGYARSCLVRQWFSLSTLGIVVFPLSFVFQLVFADWSERAELARRKLLIDKPIPVVFVVFDEFSGPTLMNEQLEIDATRYPNFARLASMSTWFRHATTNHPRTEVAIPTMLTGRFPAHDRTPPLEANYPTNLLSAIHRSAEYTLTSFEPVTRLTPAELVHRSPEIELTTWGRSMSLMTTLAAVYPRLLFPRDTPIEFPPLPRNWMGMSDSLSSQTKHLTEGVFHYNYDVERQLQLEQLLNCIKAKDRPLFLFGHIAVPHFLWEFFPSGLSYVDNFYKERFPPGGLGEYGENWISDPGLIARNEHRYLLQVSYVDRFIGKLLKRLEVAGILDECLLIVTADHGVSFRTEHSRRVPDAANMADILSVPLFIKRPGQTVGATDDRNVETVDIFPTVAEEIGLTLSESVDGTSVWDTTRRPRKSIYFDGKMTVIEPVVPKLKEAVQRRLSIFSSDSLDRPPRISSSRSGWHGLPVRRFAVRDARSSELAGSILSSPATANSNRKLTSHLVAGSVNKGSLSNSFPEIIVAANGVIMDSCRSYPDGRSRAGFSFLLPESTTASGPAEIEIFQVLSAKKSKPELIRLHRFTIQNPR